MTSVLLSVDHTQALSLLKSKFDRDAMLLLLSHKSDNVICGESNRCIANIRFIQGFSSVHCIDDFCHLCILKNSKLPSCNVDIKGRSNTS